MPAAVPIPNWVPTPHGALYNTGQTSGMNSGTTQTVGQGGPNVGLSGMGATPRSGGLVGGGGVGTNISVGVLVGGALLVLVLFHVLGFRFSADVGVLSR